MSTPKNTRCKYPHRIGVRVDDELYMKILNGAIKCDLSPSEFFRQMLKKRRPISWQKIAVVPPERVYPKICVNSNEAVQNANRLRESGQRSHPMSA